MKKIDEFKKLFEKLIRKEIDTSKFEILFNKTFFEGGLLKQMKSEEFDVLDEVWGYVEFYNPDETKRKKDSALKDEKEILEVVKVALKKLKELEENEK
ncbi:hypothetical protein HYW21_00465 [Candidatus Woesearchaeota archaeon]|nr:hypothetical protein [Candidatus Woesearchaeota archaeon]